MKAGDNYKIEYLDFETLPPKKRIRFLTKHQLIDFVQELNDTLMTVSEVSRKLGVTRLTIYRWIEAEKLPAKKQSTGFYMIDKRDLDEFLEGPINKKINLNQHDTRNN